MTVKVPMKGATLSLTIAATPTLIPQVVSIDDIVMLEKVAIDVTNLASTNKQTMKGIGDLGSLTFKVQHDPSDTTHLALESQCAADDDSVILVTLANTAASTIECTGPLMKSGKKGGGTGDLYIGEYSLKINSMTQTP